VGLRIKIRSAKDFFAGLMFVAFGGGGLAMAQAYPFGSAARMGPGYFPVLICSLLAILGLFVVARGLTADGRKLAGFHGNPLLLVLAGIVLFGFGLESWGLTASIFLLVVLSSLGGHEFRTREVLLLAVLLTAGSLAVFIVGLGLQIPIWPYSS
jgi:hypothetical protein